MVPSIRVACGMLLAAVADFRVPVTTPPPYIVGIMIEAASLIAL